jgi:hypothetical protein
LLKSAERGNKECIKIFYENFQCEISQFCNRPWRSIGLWDVKDPTLPKQCARRCPWS